MSANEEFDMVQFLTMHPKGKIYNGILSGTCRFDNYNVFGGGIPQKRWRQCGSLDDNDMVFCLTENTACFLTVHLSRPFPFALRTGIYDATVTQPSLEGGTEEIPKCIAKINRTCMADGSFKFNIRFDSLRERSFYADILLQ